MLVSFAPQRISTSGNTTIGSDKQKVQIFGARMVSTTSAAILVHIHGIAEGGTTSAATRIGSLYTSGKAVDELGYPTRVPGGVVVVTPTTTNATVYAYIR